MSLLIVDSSTWTITLLGWAIVFIALLFLVGVFIVVPKLVNRAVDKKIEAKGAVSKSTPVEISGETNAAIAMALHLYLNADQEQESNIITIKEVRRRYSPWSPKIYGMRNMNFPK